MYDRNRNRNQKHEHTQKQKQKQKQTRQKHIWPIVDAEDGVLHGASRGTLTLYLALPPLL
jgi:hypothetical protein